MSSAALRTLSDADLLRLFHQTWAWELPQGEYVGTTWNPAVPLWRGKVFTGDRVKNRIGRWLLVEGQVRLSFGTIYIDYSSGVWDRLRPVSDTVWLGQLWLGSIRSSWFTLEKTP